MPRQLLPHTTDADVFKEAWVEVYASPRQTQHEELQANPQPNTPIATAVAATHNGSSFTMSFSGEVAQSRAFDFLASLARTLRGMTENL